MSKHTASEHKTGKTTAPGNGRMALRLLFAVVAMFGFGFALVPLYDVICDITGLNGKTGGRYESVAAEVDTDRVVTVQFMTHNNAGMSWEFRPMVREVKVHPGEMKEVEFYARNPEQRTMIAQAIPSVSPSRAAEYLRKTECFCFNQQELAGGEEISMPLRFFVDQQIPEDVTKLTLSYSMFDITNNFSGKQKSVTSN